MWNKEQCRSLIKRILGLDLTDTELDGFWNHLNQSKLTPTSSGNGNNVGFSPQMLQNLINSAVERTGLTLQHPRFKRVSEEILPALMFTLLLKKISGVEHLIVSSDVPDIALIRLDPHLFNRVGNRIDAFPIEAIFINQYAMNEASGASETEKVANIIISKKLSKQYIPQTTLLVTLNLDIANLNLNEFQRILANEATNPFHQIWILLNLGEDNCVMAQITPVFASHNVSITRDLMPLMY